MINGFTFLRRPKIWEYHFLRLPCENMFCINKRFRRWKRYFRNVINLLSTLRPHNQIWIYYTMKSPFYASVEYCRGLKNWSAIRTVPRVMWLLMASGSTTRSQLLLNLTSSLRDFKVNKTQKMAWFVSNCNAVQ